MKFIIQHITHVRSMKDFILNAIITVSSAIFGYFNKAFFEHLDLFIAIVIVIIGDWIFGTIYAFKIGAWETKKALRLVYYIFAYSLALFVVLAIEKAHPSAFFLSEAVIMPILVFQLISMLKNASLIGWIPKGLLLEILEKIDNYKLNKKQQDGQDIT